MKTYIEYIGHEPLLFNLVEDPQEINNVPKVKLGGQVVKAKFFELRSILYSICSLEGVDVKAEYDQKCMRERLAISRRL